MLSTEIQRVLLLVVLGIVGYFLVYAWNEDYGKQAAPSVREAPIIDVPSATQNSVPTATPGTPPAAAAADVPGEELAGAHAVAEVPSEAPARLVHVRTSALEVWIDLVGGDIVGLQLPGYPQKINSEVPVRLLDRRQDHIYIAQSGLTGRDGLDKSGVRPMYSSSASEYAVDSGSLAVELRHETPEVVILKRFVFQAEDYLVKVEHEIENRAETEFRARLFAQLKRDSSRPDEGGIGMGMQPYVGAAFTTPESRYEKVDFEDLDEGQFRTEIEGGWAAILQHYFISAWIGNPSEVNAYNGRRLNGRDYAVGYIGPEVVVAPGQRQIVAAEFYAGPKIQKLLEAAAPNLHLTVDFGMLWWLSVPLFKVLDAIHSFTGNWGVAIILLLVCVKALLYPLASAGFRSMAKMKQVMPEMKRLQERYAGDREKLSREAMALYRKEGANPLGGCLPLLLQMPVFFALYWVLFESVELRHAPFVLWIEDLAAPDPFFVLPILYGASFYAIQLLSPTPPDPMQARVMKLMPVLFTVLFVFFPAGLVLYWLVNNLLSLAQQWYITRSIEKKAASANA